LIVPRQRVPILTALGFFAGYVVLLVLIPRWVPITLHAQTVSAAAAQGYNTQAAYWSALLWSVVIVAASAVLANSADRRVASTEGTQVESLARLRVGELAMVIALFALAYFPLFLARYGPYGEDQYFLTALSRMSCGQLPYRDFDFPYGPLMIYPLWAWSQLFGVTMTSYYSFLAILEGAQFALLMGALQLFLPNRRHRYLVFLLLLPFLFNTLMGLNWNGMRRLVPVLGIVLVAACPFQRWANVAAAILFGTQLAYSHDYASAALIGIAAIYAVSLVGEDRARSIRSGLIVMAGALITWAVAAGLSVGGTWQAYLQSTWGNVSRMAAGQAAFRFYWTANSLALFGLLTIACMAVGAAIGSGRGSGRRTLRAGDRLLLGALVCALVTLKSGLTRADLWHLNAAFLALLLFFLLRLPTAASTIGARMQRWAMGLVVLASLTYFVGILPNGSLYSYSYLNGLRDTLAGPTRAAPAEDAARLAGLEFERSVPRPAFVSLARYLAAPERKQLPVLFYGRAWVVAPMVGVCSRDYKLDDVMYSELSGWELTFLQQHPESLVVLQRSDYERNYGLADPNAAHYPMQLTPAKQLGRWLSTVHYDAAQIEARLQDQARDSATGAYVRGRYRLAAEFDQLVVLEAVQR
jgi:hypothetical protein